MLLKDYPAVLMPYLGDVALAEILIGAHQQGLTLANAVKADCILLVNALDCKSKAAGCLHKAAGEIVNKTAPIKSNSWRLLPSYRLIYLAITNFWLAILPSDIICTV